MSKSDIGSSDAQHPCVASSVAYANFCGSSGAAAAAAQRFLLIIDAVLMLKQAGLEIPFKLAIPWMPAPDPSTAPLHVRVTWNTPIQSSPSQIQSSCAFNEPGRCCAAVISLISVRGGKKIIKWKTQCLAPQNKSTLGFLALRPNTSEAKRWSAGVLPGLVHFILT